MKTKKEPWRVTLSDNGGGRNIDCGTFFETTPEKAVQAARRRWRGLDLQTNSMEWSAVRGALRLQVGVPAA